jgi:hypothetical protein
MVVGSVVGGESDDGPWRQMVLPSERSSAAGMSIA